MGRRVDVSAYLVAGPENTLGRPLGDVVRAAVMAGFTCVQVRSKAVSARELICCLREAAEAIEASGRSGRVPLLVDDRLDVALAARDAGIRVDGIHVGQEDIPPEVCRRYLGEDAIVGLSARKKDIVSYVRELDTRHIDYFGAGPLHETATKPDSGRTADGRVVTRTQGELEELARVSPVPVVVGGGVTASDLPLLAKTGVAGFFVVSAVAGAEDPGAAASELVEIWKASRG